jgi:hypothetical protein
MESSSTSALASVAGPQWSHCTDVQNVGGAQSSRSSFHVPGPAGNPRPDLADWRSPDLRVGRPADEPHSPRRFAGARRRAGGQLGTVVGQSPAAVVFPRPPVAPLRLLGRLGGDSPPPPRERRCSRARHPSECDSGGKVPRPETPAAAAPPPAPRRSRARRRGGRWASPPPSCPPRLARSAPQSPPRPSARRPPGRGRRARHRWRTWG